MSVSKKDFFTGLPLLATISLFMQGLDMTSLNTAIPAIAADLQRSPFSLQMIIISYALTSALLIPLSGWMADRYGTRRVFLSALFIYTLGSFFCAVSPNFYFLISARIFQGAGAALMVPVARLTLLKSYNPSDFIIILNYVVTPALIAPVIGPVIGGWIVTYTSWRYIFLVNVPLGIFAVIYSLYHFPNFIQERGKFDFSGFFLISFSVLSLSAAVELLGGQEGSFLAACFLAFGSLFFAFCYIRYAKKTYDPLINLSVFKIRPFVIGLTGNIIARLGIGGIPFLIPLMLQVGLGYSADIAGMILLVPAAASVIIKPFILIILDKFGYRKTLLSLTLSIGIIFSLMSLQNPNMPIYFIISQLVIQGMLMSCQFTSMNSITLGSLPAELKSDGNSLHAVSQNLSIGFGIAIATVFLRFFSELGELRALQAAFIAEGIITALSSLIFIRLKPEDGEQLRSTSSRKS